MHLIHLAKRFAGSLSTRPPAPADAAWGEQFLTQAELQLWRRLGNVDRRHALLVARRFAAARPEATRAEMAAALLHDIGKLDSRLGTVGRVVATILGPRTSRFRRYHDHERIGAEWLAAAGSEEITVALVSGVDGNEAAAALRHADDV